MSDAARLRAIASAPSPSSRQTWIGVRRWVLLSALLTMALLLVPTPITNDLWLTPTQALRIAIAIGAGVAVSVVDIREHRIPNRVSVPAVLAITASAILESIVRAVEIIGAASTLPRSSQAFLAAFEPAALTGLGGLALGGAFLALAWFGTLGLGDVKLGIVLGSALLPAFGWPALIVTFAGSYLIALPHALVLLLRRRTGAARAELAFGPYLVAAAIIALVLGLGDALPWSGSRVG